MKETAPDSLLFGEPTTDLHTKMNSFTKAAIITAMVIFLMSDYSVIMAHSCGENGCVERDVSKILSAPRKTRVSSNNID